MRCCRAAFALLLVLPACGEEEPTPIGYEFFADPGKRS